MTDDAALVDALLRVERAEPAWKIAELADVDPDYAAEALERMTTGPADYPIFRRPDLGPDVYEAIEDSSREDS